ncbi:hypothetical protein JCM17845_16890 [Iodidimonas gelatinilytica]|uniref:Uncharacterized protein n=1 Tax=Iodidimonas gelatinilytica TaxID=1236966 RepID=A0A5A7N1X3_9PROT|nr:hypothetical protein [Iodidimonas gelatinilytica]GER01066.1 hypothetical protein JCM17845_16890 [Iodidimonas gelatinilytica]
MRRSSIAIALLCSTVPFTQAVAQNRTDTAQGVVSDFLGCDPLIIPAERLTCYDTVLKQYKLKYGLIDGSPDAIAKADKARPRSFPKASTPGAVPQGYVGEERLGNNSDMQTSNARVRQGDIIRGQTIQRAAEPNDLTLPLETTITDFNSNSIGDFRIRIKEGFVFENTGTSRITDGDFSGKSVTLDKNFLGQWRAKIEGYNQKFNIKPAT